MADTRKSTPTKKKVNPTVYFIAFEHGEEGKRLVENTDANLDTIEQITELVHVRAIETALSKSFINPKVINFIPLRKKY